jgi:hypothetical protein
VAEVPSVGFDCYRPEVSGEKYLETRGLESEGEATCSTKQVYGGRLGLRDRMDGFGSVILLHR